MRFTEESSKSYDNHRFDGRRFTRGRRGDSDLLYIECGPEKGNQILEVSGPRFIKMFNTIVFTTLQHDQIMIDGRYKMNDRNEHQKHYQEGKDHGPCAQRN